MCWLPRSLQAAWKALTREPTRAVPECPRLLEIRIDNRSLLNLALGAGRREYGRNQISSVIRNAFDVVQGLGFGSPDSYRTLPNPTSSEWELRSDWRSNDAG